MPSGFRRKSPVVLFVEDCVEVCELHGAALECAGLLVRQASTLAQALEILALGVPDVIVMDRDLPDGDGFELAARLKASTETRGVRIIGFTASGASSAIDAHLVGMDGFIAKPCPPAKLVALTRLLLEAEAGLGLVVGERDGAARAC